MEQAETREEKRRVVAMSTQYGNWKGLDLGVHYEQPGAFVPDGVPPPAPADPIVDYEPCAKPGYRAPHLWLRRGNVRQSAISLFDRHFVLLTGSEGFAWAEAATRLSREQNVPMLSYRIGEGGDLVAEVESFTDLYGIQADGAVLVRPDGHVAFRSSGRSPDALHTLQTALDRVLARVPQESKKQVDAGL